MGMEFNYPTEANPAVTWKPSKPPRYPIRHTRDFYRQARGQTAGGAVLVQDPLGPAQEIIELEFDHLPQTDLDQAALFFDTVRRSAATFDFTDATGQLTRVRWWNAFEFEQAAFGRHSGTIQLRKESGA